MLLFPPYQISRNGIVFNMGYDWLFSPPERGNIVAAVNVSMLLVEWLASLIIGSLAFMLTKYQHKEVTAITDNPSISNSLQIKGAKPQANVILEFESTNVTDPANESELHSEPPSTIDTKENEINELNFFEACWHGKERLWKAYWLLGLAAGVIFKLADLPTNLSVQVTLFFLIVMPVQILWWVSVWRCAFRCSHWVWAIIARWVVAISVVTTIIILIFVIIKMI
jgi:hypothetical protein